MERFMTQSTKNGTDEVLQDENQVNDAHPEEQIRKRSSLDFKKYTKQIWLAGLGAFSRAEEEGNRLFDSLVKVGEELETKTTDIADSTVEAVGEVKERMTERVSDTKERVERALDERVNLTLSRIGLASHREVTQLMELIERLDKKVDALSDELKKLNAKK
jgi:poly(hydroxyalkanoate) granule-associated protein